MEVGTSRAQFRYEVHDMRMLILLILAFVLL
jgi:hypothetical protein